MQRKVKGQKFFILKFESIEKKVILLTNIGLKEWMEFELTYGKQKKSILAEILGHSCYLPYDKNDVHNSARKPTLDMI